MTGLSKAREAAADGEPEVRDFARLERALTLSPPASPERAELELLLGSALVELGQLEDGIERVEAAAASGDQRIEAHARLQLAFAKAMADPDNNSGKLLEHVPEALAVGQELGDGRLLAMALYLTGLDRFFELRLAQAAVDEWVEFYNTQRPHQSLDMDVPAARFTRGQQTSPRPIAGIDRSGDDWVSRRVGANGVVCVSWQQVSVGKHHAGARCDVQVTDQLLQFLIGNELCKAVARTSRGEVRKKRASVPQSIN